MRDSDALTSTAPDCGFSFYLGGFGPIWWLMNLLCWIRRGKCRAKRGGCSHRFSLRFFFGVNFPGWFWIKPTFPHVFEGREQWFLFWGSVQLVHLDRFLCCELAVYFLTSKFQHFWDHYPLWNPIHFSDGKWNCSMSWHWEGICSEWVWDKLLNHKVEANHQKNVFNRECAGWWHEDLTWVMLGSCRQSWPVPRACLCQTCGTASGRCIMQLPRVCCPRHLRRANSAGPRWRPSCQ